MPMFRKKPVVIEAEQFTRDSERWPEGVCATFQNAGSGLRELSRRCAPGTSPCDATKLDSPWKPHVHTLEGVHQVTEGDWIITGIKGERYPCKPDIFAATYEPAAPEPPRDFQFIRVHTLDVEFHPGEESIHGGPAAPDADESGRGGGAH